jgi:hypothetical protein
LDEAENLETARDEILSALKDQSFKVFHGSDVGNGGPEFRWKDSKDWKGFLDLAQQEQVRIVIYDERTFDKEELEGLLASMPEEAMKSAIGAESLRKLRSTAGKVGAVNICWVKDGVKYSLHRTTEWFDDLAEFAEHLESMEEREGPRESGIPVSSFVRAPLPKSVKSKSPEDLAQEMIEFGKKELGSLDLRSFYHASRLFWQRMGVADFGDSEAELLKEKVRMIAETRLTEELQKSERELLPRLVEECSDWADKYGFPKLTKQNLKAFLAEKNHSLTRSSEDILLVQVNAKLKAG